MRNKISAIAAISIAAISIVEAPVSYVVKLLEPAQVAGTNYSIQTKTLLSPKSMTVIFPRHSKEQDPDFVSTNGSVVAMVGYIVTGDRKFL